MTNKEHQTCDNCGAITDAKFGICMICLERWEQEDTERSGKVPYLDENGRVVDYRDDSYSKMLESDRLRDGLWGDNGNEEDNY